MNGESCCSKVLGRVARRSQKDKKTSSKKPSTFYKQRKTSCQARIKPVAGDVLCPTAPYKALLKVLIVEKK